MNQREALIALAHIVEPADHAVGAFVDEVGPVAAVEAIARGCSLRHGSALRARLAAVDLGAALAQARSAGIRIIDRTGPDWPAQLDGLGPARPYALWALGPLPVTETVARSVAVVGARASTPYGEAVCREWCAAFAEAGFTVVSGGAYGIDGAAHRAVLAAGGRTVCVLAGGVDVHYPPSNAALIGRIADVGLVISEVPLGQRVRRQRFLSRNRLVAGLARVTVVIEADLRSGTTSTANAAAAQNRPVLAVPGPVTSPMSAGCHRLIAEGGAMIAMSAADVLSMAGAIGELLLPEPPARPTDHLTPWQKRVLDAVPASGAVGLEELMLGSGLALGDVASCLAELQRSGFVVPLGRGWALPGRG